MTTKTDQLARKENPAVKFTNRVVREFTGGDHTIALTNFQKRLVQNYFIALNSVLAKAEEGRLRKSEKYRDKIPVTWENVNMEKLVQDVVAVARIGFDPAQKNHINMIPYKNNTTKLYDVGFIEGYRGIELKSTKYGLDIPDAVIVKLVYSNDKFKSIMKDHNNKFESYEFEIVNDFDRGDIVGGFYYHQYTENPAKNKLVVMSLEDIEKRKPKYASVEFWGGEKSVWKEGKKTSKTETVKGWYKEMCHKTVARAAYNDITIDSQKIDADYLRMKEIEGSVAEHNIQAEIDERANKKFIDIESGEVTEPPVGTKEPTSKPSPETPEKSKTEKDTKPPTEEKESSEPQGAAISEKDGKEPDSFGDDRSEEEKENVKIKEFQTWLEESKKQGVLKDAIDNMKKGYLKKFSTRVQEEVEKICKVLTAGEKKATEKQPASQGPDF